MGIEDGCTVHLAIYSTDQVSMFYILDYFVVLCILPSPDSSTLTDILLSGELQGDLEESSKAGATSMIRPI